MENNRMENNRMENNNVEINKNIENKKINWWLVGSGVAIAAVTGVVLLLKGKKRTKNNNLNN